MTTLREAIQQASAGLPHHHRRRAGDADQRNALLRYAYARGATVRQLCEASGIQSTSTMFDIVYGAQRPAWVDPLDAEAPDADALAADEARHKPARKQAA